MVSPEFQGAYDRFKNQKGLKTGEDYLKAKSKFESWQQRTFGLSHKQEVAFATAVKVDGIKPVKESVVIYKGKGGKPDRLRIVFIDPSTGRFIKRDGSYTPRKKRDNNE